MENMYYLLLGLLTSFFGALPVGTVNLSVVHATIKHNLSTAMKISIAAGVAEVIITFSVIQYSLIVTNYINNNLYLQLGIGILLFVVGILFFISKAKNIPLKEKKTSLLSNSGKGFFLALFNPAVWIYWLFIISYLTAKNTFNLNSEQWSIKLILFFSGVYAGKIAALYLYSKLSVYIQQKVNNIAHYLNKIIGITLLIIGVFQITKILLTNFEIS